MSNRIGTDISVANLPSIDCLGRFSRMTDIAISASSEDIRDGIELEISSTGHKKESLA